MVSMPLALYIHLRIPTLASQPYLALHLNITSAESLQYHMHPNFPGHRQCILSTYLASIHFPFQSILCKIFLFRVFLPFRVFLARKF